MSDLHVPATSHGDHVPDAADFQAQRARWLGQLGRDQDLRETALTLQRAADEHGYGLVREWAGVPVIRLADDIVALQELIWERRPHRIIETGIARGGSLLLDASLMRMAGVAPAVLGLDISIFPHTRTALVDHPLGEGVVMVEADSTSEQAVEATREFIGDSERALLVLDSNHTHEHVLGELRALAPLLPVGSHVLVADTLIEEHPAGYYANRPWDRGDNPLTAVREFLGERSDFVLDEGWSRRALVTEFRDGVLIRTSA